MVEQLLEVVNLVISIRVAAMPDGDQGSRPFNIILKSMIHGIDNHSPLHSQLPSMASTATFRVP